jgi:hypothetical protein
VESKRLQLWQNQERCGGHLQWEGAEGEVVASLAAARRPNKMVIIVCIVHC